jgi:hypothetical protein
MDDMRPRAGCGPKLMLKISPQAVLIDTNDDGLRHYVHSLSKVFAIFSSVNCPICEVLEPAFAKLASEKLAQGIQFVRLSSQENPVAKRLMAEQSAPFFVSYRQGRMVECGTCVTEAEMLQHLTRLQNMAPEPE